MFRHLWIFTVSVAILFVSFDLPAQQDMKSRLEAIKRRQSQAAKKAPEIKVKVKGSKEEEEEAEVTGVIVEKAPTILTAIVKPYALTLNTMQERAEAQLGPAGGHLVEELRQDQLRHFEEGVLMEWVINATLSQVSTKEGFSVSKNEIAECLSELASAAGYPEDPAKALGDFGIDLKTYIPELEHSILTEKYIFSEIDRRVSKADLRKLYEGKKTHFYTPKRVRLRAIVKDLSQARNDEDLIKMIEDMERAEKLLRRGGDFAEIASEVSDARLSAARGGDMGWMTPSNILGEPYNRKIFDMVVGKTSKLLGSDNGRYLYIFRVEEKEPEKTQPFDKVQRELKFLLYDEVKAQLYQQQRRQYSIYINASGIPPKYMEKVSLDKLQLF